MGNIYKALPYFLENNNGVSTLVSARIYPLRLPQTVTLPAIVFQDVSLTTTQAHKEKSALPTPRFQFTIYGGKISDIDAIGAALKAALDGYRGNMGTGAYVTRVDSCILKGQSSNDDSDAGVYLRYIDFSIKYKE